MKRKKRRLARRRLHVETLETRNLLSATDLLATIVAEPPALVAEGEGEGDIVEESWTCPGCWAGDPSKPKHSDINGDGRSDWFYGTAVTDDAGNSLEIWVIDPASGTGDEWWAPIYNHKYLVGKCPYLPALNSTRFRYVKDLDGSGKPDQLLGVTHISRDTDGTGGGEWLWGGVYGKAGQDFYSVDGKERMEWEFDISTNMITVTQFNATAGGSVIKRLTQCPAPITGNKYPVANAGLDQWDRDLDGNGFEMVTLDGSASYDPEGHIHSYRWTEDGTVLGNGAVLTRSLSTGWHEVTLTVTDCLLRSHSDTVIVNVLPPPPTPVSVTAIQPYVQDFSSGLPGSPQGWELYSTHEGRMAVVDGRLRMDDRVGNSTYSQNQAILHLDLFGQSNVRLSGNHWNLSDEAHDGDGIAISEDGVTWHNVPGFDASSTMPFRIDLDAAAAAAGISYTSDFSIMFRQYDNYPASTDGREWDDIRVEIITPPTPQVVSMGQPYVQNFSAGRPGRSQGWEYDSTNEGRITVVSGRLRMDDQTGNSTYSQNDAILHVNLQGQSRVQLSGYHGNLSDEANAGDGIAISNNGVTWHPVTAFDVSSTGAFVVNLDAAIADAKITYSADFRIKFQQNDNYPAETDGREWDNIRVEVTEPPKAQVVTSGQPYVQGFSGVRPGGPLGWEYNSTGTGRIAVVGGRLRMDDQVDDAAYSQNDAILHLNLQGQSNVQLSGDHWNLSDEDHPGDGIAISNNGLNWHPVTAFDVSSTGGFVVNLDTAAAAAGISYSSDFRIKFQQYDNYAADVDGREWDNIRVEIVAPPTPQVVQSGQPYVQEFSGVRPGRSQGWEFNSTSTGRIAVVGGRLRMDDKVDDAAYSQNDAILHLNLQGQSNVQLSGDHWNLSDEDHPGDGIAISKDGLNWHPVTAFDVSSTGGFVVNLDTAAAEAGINYNTPDFRIKFQQYDNYAADVDGREWDNIRVEIVAPPTPQVVQSGQPYVQEFSGVRPGRSQGWEYNSTSTGRIAVVGGRLRMDDQVDDAAYSQNEAILHLNLQGQSNVRLSGNHWNLSDEGHPGDGIAISSDGVTWHEVTAFDISSTGAFLVDLDEAIAAAGINYTSDFLIKFGQYDNYSADADGREWDNIRVDIA